jgi:hypothetical protein
MHALEIGFYIVMGIALLSTVAVVVELLRARKGTTGDSKTDRRDGNGGSEPARSWPARTV